MARVKVSKEFKFSMGHALWEYKGKCANLHGHNYRCEVEASCEAEDLTEVGFVVDFGELKIEVAEVVDRLWDHKTLLHQDDTRFEGIEEEVGVFRVPWNPTGENLAATIFQLAQKWADANHPQRVRIDEVRLWETDTGLAIVSRR